MPLFDRNIVSKEINEVGESVTIRVVSKTIDDWGDATKTTSDTSGVKAIAKVISESDDIVKEGIFQSGDIFFYFKGNASNISRGNRIIWNSKTYEIKEVIVNYLIGINYFTEARTKIT